MWMVCRFTRSTQDHYRSLIYPNGWWAIKFKGDWSTAIKIAIALGRESKVKHKVFKD